MIFGIYHHKLPIHSTSAFGFTFPVAIDGDRITLRNWWFDKNPKARWTSVSFLIDRTGIIRHIHPGGQYVKGDDDYALLKSRIEELLDEKREE